MTFSNEIVGGGGILKREAIMSPNYQAGAVGWTINADGSAEFNDVVIRGGTTEGGVALFYDGTPAAGNLVGSIAAAAGTDAFGNPYEAGVTAYGPDGSSVQVWSNPGGGNSAEIDFQPPALTGHDFATGAVTAASFVQAVGNGSSSTELVLNSPSDVNVPGGDTNSSITLGNGNGGDSVVSIDGGICLIDTPITEINGVVSSSGAKEASSVRTDSGTVTSSTYTAARAGSPTPGVAGVAFIAPASGKVKISWHCGLSNTSTTAFQLVSFEVRNGAVVGSGSVVVAASDSVTIQHAGTTAEESKSTWYPLDAGQLTPGGQYNVQLMYRVSGGTCTVNRPRVMVEPLLG